MKTQGKSESANLSIESLVKGVIPNILGFVNNVREIDKTNKYENKIDDLLSYMGKLEDILKSNDSFQFYQVKNFALKLYADVLSFEGKSNKGKKKSLLSELENLITYCLCLLYTSPSPRDATLSRMPSSA